MPVETAADLAAFYEQSEFAEAAIYSGPEIGELPIPCTVIIDRGQARGGFGDGERSSSTSERALRVRAVEATPRRGGTFAILDGDGVPTGEVLGVAGTPSLDQTAAVWSVDLVIQS